MQMGRLTRAAATMLVLITMCVVLGKCADEKHWPASSSYRRHHSALRQESETLAITKFALRYTGSANAVMAIEIDITICFSCGGVLPGEHVWVVLPGFSRQNMLNLSAAKYAKAILTEGAAADIFASATWNAEDRSLTFLCSSKARNGRNYVVSVPISGGLTSPVAGIRSDSQFMYYTDSINGGPRQPQPVLQSNFRPVGFITTSIDFEPREAGAASKISISLTPSMNIKALELITVVLPRFICQAHAPCSHLFIADFTVLSNLTSTFKAQSQWIDSQTMLSMQLNRDVENGDTAHIVISKSAGLTISDLGLRVNDETITMATAAQDGPVLPTSIGSSPGIGALVFVSISLSTADPFIFFEAQPGREASVHVSFALNRDLLPGDTVTVGLGGFQSNLDANELLPTGNLQLKYARWVASSEYIVLTTNYVVIASMRVELTLQQTTFGLKLPLTGIVAGSDIFKFSTNSEEGPIDRTTIAHNLAVGSFTGTALEFSYPMAGHATDISIRFTTLAPLIPGDQIEISLPGFSSLDTYPARMLPSYCAMPDACMLCRSICVKENRAGGKDFLIIPNDQLGGTSAGLAQPFQAAWSQTLPNTRLVLAVTCGMKVEGGEPQHVIVKSSAGICLPAAAIPLNR